jgi:hypothetical protein
VTERTEDVFVIIDQHTGRVHGTRFYVSEEHAIKSIQDRGFQYNAMENPIMPAKLVYRSDRK